MPTTNSNANANSQSSHSSSEVGHAKNVANLQTLIIACQSFGSSYNPANSLITITALQALYANSFNALNDVTAKNNALSHNINTRHLDFAPIKALATQVMAALLASGANAQTMLNAQTINRKIQGSRASKKAAANTGSGSSPVPTPTGGGKTPTGGGNPVTVTPAPSTEKQFNPISIPITPVTVSVSQQSFDNLVDHFNALVNYVSQFPAYNPNEAILKVVALNTLVAHLTASNNNVKTTQVALNNSRTTRTIVLYDKTNGLVQIAKEVKGYVKSIFNASSLQFKQISKIPFREISVGKHHKHLKK
jgi:hypothetical protein